MSPAPASPRDLREWLETSLTSGDVLAAGSDVRSHVFHWVRAERDGPLTRQLLAFTTDRRASVRRALFELFDDLGFARGAWPVVADAAEAALRDEDPRVRRIAAAVFAHVAEPGRVFEVLIASPDPAVRIALAEAARHELARHPAVVERLRSDPVAAVRLLAVVAAFSEDDPAAWPALDEAARAELEGCTGVLGVEGRPFSCTAAGHWSRALTGLDREEDCYRWAERLTGRSEAAQIKLEGVRMSRAAMRVWRAAPARLTPALAPLLRDDCDEVRSAALRALTASLTASRLAADELVAVLDDPELGAPAATALGRAGDGRAMPYLVRLMLTGSDEPGLGEAFRELAGAGADPREPVAAARRVLAAQPDSSEPDLPMRVLAAFGPAAAPVLPELIARLEGAENDTPDRTIHVLGRIGPAAAAAAPLLRQYPTVGATLALLRITSDRTVAERYLAGRPEELRRGGISAAMLTWLVEHGGLDARQQGQLRSAFRNPGSGQVDTAGARWLHEGPAIADELLEVLPQYLSNDLYGTRVLRVLAAMGPYARPILDRLDAFASSRHRAGMNLGDEDTEMRADETLLAAVVAARRQIAG
ncbi:HEAT repeat domain-containing protein [Actinoplanes sp. NPDC023801]|uniref:HEAT repeat domain-containing protein n=1 Tax=Actinoplanes sp. NPDC023801 TaxID=3154595 RepID=UPI0033D7AC6A